MKGRWIYGMWETVAIKHMTEKKMQMNVHSARHDPGGSPTKLAYVR
ncbi:MAG TPA: hypothetical protein VK463_11445 [Desulfomonilaceae bacterium]|nr:hypothetical protein [Desulfomonilaceae bacterium]